MSKQFEKFNYIWQPLMRLCDDYCPENGKQHHQNVLGARGAPM